MTLLLVSSVVSLQAIVFSGSPPPSFQRLYQAGWPHARVSLVYTATSSLTVALHLRFSVAIWLGSLRLYLVLDKFIAVPFSFASDS